MAKLQYTSPFGTASYPHLSKPDTQGKFADNKFKTKLDMSLGDKLALAFIDTIEAAAKELGKAGEPKRPYKKDEATNTVTFTFKSQYQPSIFDGKNNPIPSSIYVGGGSVIRCMGVFIPYDGGIAMALNDVQVKTLNGPGVSRFEEVEDGYEVYTSAPDATAQATPTGAEGSTNAALDI